MNTSLKKLRDYLLKIVAAKLKNDPSHDINHIQRVLNMAIKIGEEDGADLEILIPATIFHDAIIYPKNDPRSKRASDKSALFAKRVLRSKILSYGNYPADKIDQVMLCISECSFSKGIQGSTLESKILQDADKLEATGAISIMRTFTSGGLMNRGLYNPDDPFCQKELPSGVSQFSLDLFYQRLLRVKDLMHTKAAQKIAERRHLLLLNFIQELKLELEETQVYG